MSVAASKGWHRWQVWKKFSHSHKQARVLHVEIVYNLLLCHAGERVHPPQLLLTRHEWLRPTSSAVLAKVLNEREMILVAVPYIMIDSYERVFGKAWPELLLWRLKGDDVLTVRLLVGHFAEAELALRKKLYPKKIQESLAKALSEQAVAAALGPAQTTVPFQTRLANAIYSIPPGWPLAAWFGFMSWRLWTRIRATKTPGHHAWLPVRRPGSRSRFDLRARGPDAPASTWRH
jgi:hypothetical protein